jgi:homoserine O-acetyltransferase
MSLSSDSLRSADSAAEPDCSPRTITPTSPRLSAGREQFEFDLNLRHAGMRRVCLRVEWTGDLSLPALWLAGGISANRHVCANSVDGAPGWWQDAMGPQRALNPQHFCLLACDWLGADGQLDLPIDSADQADAIAYVLERLGIVRLHAFVGASYGGMVGQQFAIRHRLRLERLVSCPLRIAPHRSRAPSAPCSARLSRLDRPSVPMRLGCRWRGNSRC